MLGSAPSAFDAIAQSTLRAKPCCWISPGPNCGKQNGMPPEIGFEPSSFASGRTASASLPSLTYDVTHAPKLGKGGCGVGSGVRSGVGVAQNCARRRAELQRTWRSSPCRPLRSSGSCTRAPARSCCRSPCASRRRRARREGRRPSARVASGGREHDAATAASYRRDRVKLFRAAQAAMSRLALALGVAAEAAARRPSLRARGGAAAAPARLALGLRRAGGGRTCCGCTARRSARRWRRCRPCARCSSATPAPPRQTAGTPAALERLRLEASTRRASLRGLGVDSASAVRRFVATGGPTRWCSSSRSCGRECCWKRAARVPVAPSTGASRALRPPLVVAAAAARRAARAARWRAPHARADAADGRPPPQPRRAPCPPRRRPEVFPEPRRLRRRSPRCAPSWRLTAVVAAAAAAAAAAGRRRGRGAAAVARSEHARAEASRSSPRRAAAGAALPPPRDRTAPPAARGGGVRGGGGGGFGVARRPPASGRRRRPACT